MAKVDQLQGKNSKPVKGLPSSSRGMRYRRRFGRHGIKELPKSRTSDMQVALEAAVVMLGPFPPPPGAQAGTWRHYGPGDALPIIKTRKQAQSEVTNLVQNYRRCLELAEETPRPREFVDHLSYVARLAAELRESITSLSWSERMVVRNPGHPAARFRDRDALRALLAADVPVRLTETFYCDEALEMLVAQSTGSNQNRTTVFETEDEGEAAELRRGPSLRFISALPATNFDIRLEGSRSDGLLADLLHRTEGFFSLLSEEMRWDLTNGKNRPLDRGGNIDIRQLKDGTPNWLLASAAWGVAERSPNLRASKARSRKAPPADLRQALGTVGVFEAPSLPAFLEKIVEAATGRNASDFDMFGAELAILQRYRPRMLDLRHRMAKLHLCGRRYSKVDVWARLGNPCLQVFEGWKDADPARVSDRVVRSIRSNWRRYHILDRQMEAERSTNGRNQRLHRRTAKDSKKSNTSPAAHT